MRLRNLIKSAKIEIINFLISRKNSSKNSSILRKTRVAKLSAIITSSLCCIPGRAENVGKCFSREFSSGRTRRRRAPLEGGEFNDTPEGGFRAATLTLRESSMMVGAKRCSAYWIAYRFTFNKEYSFRETLGFENFLYD